MRDVFGILAICLAIVALGVFRVPDENALVAAGIKAAAEAALYQEPHPLSVAVKGRVVTVSGRVESEADLRSVAARLSALDGVDEVRTELVVMPVVTPFVLSVTKHEADVQLTGHAPSAALAQRIIAELGLAEAGVALPVASGVPDRDWGAVALLAAEQVAGMLDAEMVLQDRALSLGGTTHLPARAAAIAHALEDLPEDYSLSLDLEAVDDGTPYRFHMARDGLLGLRLAGKLPPDFDEAALAVLGSPQDSALERAPLPLDAPGFAPALQAVLPLAAGLTYGVVTVGAGLVTLEGGPVSEAQLADAEALAAQLPEGYALHLALVPEDEDTPWHVTLDWDGETLAFDGRVPRDFDAQALADSMQAPLDAARLAFAPYRDLQGWAAPLAQAVAGLRLLERGQVVLDSDGLRVSGVAADPLVRRQASRAGGGLNLSEVMLADDGAPLVFALRYDATRGGAVSGKLPEGLRLPAMAEALGLPRLRGTPVAAPVGDGAETLDVLSALAPWLVEMEAFALNYDEGSIALRVETPPAVPPATLMAALAPGLPGDVDLSVIAAPRPATGSTRTHAVLGLAQIFTDGYWFPVLGFAASRERCDAEMAEAPAVAFAPGRFLPGLGSAQPLAHLAAVARACTRLADLDLVIEATASSARADVLNRQLSRRRAEAVRADLVARGVPASRIEAQELGPVRADGIVYRWQ